MIEEEKAEALLQSENNGPKLLNETNDSTSTVGSSRSPIGTKIKIPEKSLQVYLHEAQQENNSDAIHEIKQLMSLVKQERSHGQWMKQFFNFSSLIVLIVMQVFRSPKLHLEVSLKKCSVEDWSVETAYCLILFALIYFATKGVAREQELKKKYGSVNLVDSDLRFEGHTLR